MTMTQQYLIGELSILLARLQALAPDARGAASVAHLRSDAERRGLCALGEVELRALAIADRLCWSSLSRRDIARFDQVAAAGSELWEFGVCAGLLTTPWAAVPPR